MYDKKRLNAVVWHPRLLFVSDSHSLSVYAIPNGKVTEKTMTYLPPYDNLGSGSLCFGDVKRPNSIRDMRTFINEMERAFTFGEFTHATYLDYWKKRVGTDAKVNLLGCKKFKTINQLL